MTPSACSWLAIVGNRCHAPTQVRCRTQQALCRRPPITRRVQITSEPDSVVAPTFSTTGTLSGISMAAKPSAPRAATVPISASPTRPGSAAGPLPRILVKARPATPTPRTDLYGNPADSHGLSASGSIRAYTSTASYNALGSQPGHPSAKASDHDD